MTLARLLTAALVVCSMPAFAQDQQSQSSRLCAVPSGTGCIPQSKFLLESFFGPNSATTAAQSESWWHVPSRPADVHPGYNALDPARLDQYRLDQIKGDLSLRHLKLDALDPDTTCYTIRTYVVARNSKDSESTHPAGYLTCQPSNRYQVKSAEIRVVSGDR